MEMYKKERDYKQAILNELYKKPKGFFPLKDLKESLVELNFKEELFLLYLNNIMADGYVIQQGYEYGLNSKGRGLCSLGGYNYLYKKIARKNKRETLTLIAAVIAAIISSLTFLYTIFS